MPAWKKDLIQKKMEDPKSVKEEKRKRKQREKERKKKLICKL